MSLGVTHCPRAPWDRRCPSPCRGLRRRARRCPCPRLRPRPRPRHRPRRRPRHPHRALCLRRCHPRPRRPRPRGGGTVRLLGGPRDVWSTPFWFVQGGRVDPRHSLASTLTTTHAVRSIVRGAWSPRSEGRCAPALGRHGHTTWLGVWAAWFRRGVFRGCRAGRARHTFRVADGRAGDPAPSTVWCAGVALRLVRTMRASACATAEGAGGRVSTPASVPTSLLRGKRCAGSHAWGRLQAAACSRRARFCDAVARRVGSVRSGRKQRGASSAAARAAGVDWGPC